MSIGLIPDEALHQELAETKAKLERAIAGLEKIATKEIWRGDPQAQASAIAKETLNEIATLGRIITND